MSPVWSAFGFSLRAASFVGRRRIDLGSRLVLGSRGAGGVERAGFVGREDPSLGLIRIPLKAPNFAGGVVVDEDFCIWVWVNFCSTWGPQVLVHACPCFHLPGQPILSTFC